MSTEKNVKFIQGTEVINSYLKTVRRYDVLSDAEEKELFKRYSEGDLSARDQIILSNQRFLYSQAKIYAKNEEDIMDYVIAEPANYQMYCTGWLEFEELKDKAEDALGNNFNEQDFHQAVLDAGPCQFYKKKKKVDEYINSVN